MVPKAKALLLHRRRYEVQDRRLKESLKVNPRTIKPRKKIRQKIVEMIQRTLLVSRILDLFQVIHLKMESISKFVKGSSDQSHFIFEINVGKGRIRHGTTLKFDF